MKLAKAVDSYLTLKRSLGAVFSAEARILRSFARALGDILLDDINREATYGFCRGTGPPTRWWERKHYTLRDFFVYLVTRGHMSSSPLPELAPRIPRSFEPYIYSREELQRLLDSTEILADNRSPSSTPRSARCCSSCTARGFGPARLCGSGAATWTSMIASSPSGIRSSSSLGSCPSALH